jgi:CubicO group peptidase (beta-lactamase class C family)
MTKPDTLNTLDTITLPSTPFPLGGYIAKGYEPVLKAFINNFKEHNEVGACVAAFHKGEKVIDLWGGYANKEQNKAWQEDTLMVVFSASKGVASLCLLMLADQGLLDYDLPVSHYWKEFAQNGKEEITVRQLLTHTSGLSGIETPIRLEELATNEGKAKLKATLESQTPLFKPGTDQGYNAITFGMYAAELFKQVSGEDMVDFYRREIQTPLQADFWIGNADTQSERIARIYQMSTLKRLGKSVVELIRGGTAEANVIRTLLKPNSLPKKAFINPHPGPKGPAVYVDNLVQSNAFWWGGGFSNGRGLAKIYAPLSTQGTYQGVQLVKPDTLKNIYPITSWSKQDRVIGKALGWNQGFLKEEANLFSPNTEAFGHAGMGGSLGWADPVAELSFGYTMNYLDHRIRSPRCLMLCDALYESEALS